MNCRLPSDAVRPDDTRTFLTFAVLSILVGVGLFVVCLRDYRKQGAVAAVRTVATVHGVVRRDSDAGHVELLIAPDCRIHVAPSVTVRFDVDVAYDVHYCGDEILSFERRSP